MLAGSVTAPRLTRAASPTSISKRASSGPTLAYKTVLGMAIQLRVNWGAPVTPARPVASSVDALGHHNVLIDRRYAQQGGGRLPLYTLRYARTGAPGAPLALVWGVTRCFFYSAKTFSPRLRRTAILYVWLAARGVGAWAAR